MALMKIQNKPTEMYEEMIEKVLHQINKWREDLEHISERLTSCVQPQFTEIQDFLLTRLTSFASTKNQGYTLQGFELDSEMASYLFLELVDDEFVFNQATKPDYVIIMNRMLDQADFCTEIKMMLPDDQGAQYEESENQRTLKKY